MRSIKWICVFLFGALFFDFAFAQTTIAPEEELGKKVRAASEVKPLGSTPFGEEISTYDGTLSFRQTDIDQPGLGLPLQLTRTYRTDDALRYSAFVDWKLEIPHIETLSANASGTEGDTPSTWFFLNDANRCSNFIQAPTIVLSTGTSSPGPVFYFPTKWWNGYQLVIPGSGAQDLLLRDSSNTASPQMPSDGGGLRNFHIVTKQNWMVSCLASTSNGKPGEGFLVVSPDGVKYWMDWLTYRKYKDVGYAQPGFGGVARRTAMMMVSRVEDRFGNSLSYSYDANGDLVSIQASDGRGLVLTYDSWQVAGMQQPSTRIRTATLSSSDTPSRTWAYTYSAASDPLIDQRLKGIVQPDGSAWSFNIGGLRYSNGAGPLVVYDYYDGCDYEIKNTTLPMQGEIVHPSGLIGQFNLKLAVRGRSYAPFLCGSLYGSHSLDVANVYTVAAMDQKKISGPGVPAQIWNYSYSSANQSWAKDCSSNCATNVWTDVTDPAGKAVRYTYSNRYDVSEGRLLRKDYFSGASGSSVVRAEEYSYASATAGPWPSRMGAIRQPNVNKDQLEQLAPVVTNTVTQDGSAFVRATEQLDSFARPLRVARSSSLGYSRTDVTAYHDNTTKWVLGQTAKVTCVAPTTALPAGCGASGTIVSETTYNASAQPAIISSFGKLQQSLTYNVNGTIATVKDGNNNVTTLSNWKRGIPQSIKHPITPESPTGATQSAVVNDNGWITSVTDENGYKTCYAYDAMGRMSQITYPSETTAGVCDASTWAPTTQTFEIRNVVDHGIAAGHWRQVVGTGNGRKYTYFDALWRPLLIHEQDNDNPGAGNTLRTTSFTYDHEGRVTFASYPVSALLGGTTGTWTDYDALGRVTSVTQDSELGLLTTATHYMTPNGSDGYYTAVINPRGQTTRTWFQAFDQPNYSVPRRVQHADGSYTDVNRDVFGKPTAIIRRNSNSTVSLTRSYAYNGNQELCRSVEPETGATLTGYDAAGNLKWSAAGLPAATACEANGTSAAVATRRADRTYDARNRVKTLSFPNGLGNTTYAYTPDGLPSSVATDNGATDGQATLNYFYNKRRLITREILITPQLNWPYDYGYNANGHLAVNNWHGLSIDYAPNALGQPTKAGTYASGVSYYPNGALKQFTYGNGIVHTMTQNARQLPSRSTDSVTGSTPLDLGYAYDKHANVSGVTDYLTGARQTRGMSYDNLDRLTQTTSSMFGTATYGYNVLDNLTTVNVAGGSKARNHAYVYDTNNRLANVTTGVGGPTVIGLGYDLQGNLANKSGVLYSFDYGNRLRTVTDSVGGKTSTYAYDGQGRRVKDVVNGLAKHSQYTQNGQLVMVGDDRATDVSEYVYLQGSLLAIRVRDVPTAAYTTKYQHTDALGTPIAVTSQSRTLLETSEYEPFGQQVNAVGAPKDGPGYTGHVQDAATGLTYMQQRYYDPMIGRTLSVDPVTAYDTGDWRHFNVYAYAYNNPYSFTDPDGRQAIDKKEPPPPPPPPPPTTLPTVTATAPQPATLGTVTVIGPRMEPIGRPIPWGGIGAGISSTAGAWISGPFLFFFSPHPCGGAPCGERTTMTSDFPRGVWPGPSGAEEWGRRNGVGPQEGRRRFHEIKQREKGQGGGKGKENYGVNPDTGEVVNPAGEEAGNLGDGQAQ